MNPIGLTRAEQEKEQPVMPAPSHEPAPAGTTRCIATTQPKGDVCGAEAWWLITWPDPDPKTPKTPMCTDCKDRFVALARSHGSSVGVDPITKEKK